MAALEVLALDEATPQIRAPGTGDTYTLPRAAAIVAGTLTTDVKVLDLSATWNAAGVAFTGVKLNITNTASAAASLPLDVQVGGTSYFRVDKNGNIRFGNSGAGAEIRSAGSGGSILFNPQDITGRSSFYSNYEGRTQIVSGGFYGWTNNTVDASSGATLDLALYKDATAILALRNGTAAQTFRVYNTYTDASNYERGFVRWATNVLEIGAEAAGTGTQRNVSIAANGGSIVLSKTITAGGTTGAQTINKSSGQVNFAAAATSLVVTNSLVNTNSIITCELATNDATARIANVEKAAGSFTINLTAAATAETACMFRVTN